MYKGGLDRNCSAYGPPHALLSSPFAEFNASRYTALIRQVCYGRKKERNANGLALGGAVAAMLCLADRDWTETTKTGFVLPWLVPPGRWLCN